MCLLVRASDTHSMPWTWGGEWPKEFYVQVTKNRTQGELEQLTLCIRGLTSTDSVELRTEEDADAEPTDTEGQWHWAM